MPLQTINMQSVLIGTNSKAIVDFGRIRSAAEYSQNIAGKAIQEENNARGGPRRVYRASNSNGSNLLENDVTGDDSHLPSRENNKGYREPGGLEYDDVVDLEKGKFFDSSQ